MHRFHIDSDGKHKCDHTRSVDTKQLDDGSDHTFVSVGGSEAFIPSFLFKVLPPLMFCMLLSIRLCRTDTKVQ